MLHLQPSSTPGRIQDKPSDRTLRNDVCHGTCAPNNAGTDSCEAFLCTRTSPTRTLATQSHQIKAAGKCAGLLVTAAARF